MIFYYIMLYNMVSYCTIWYHIVQYGIILYNMVSYCTIWYHIVQYGTILYNIILCYNITYVPRRGAIGSKPIFLYKCVALLGLLWGCCGPLGALKGPLGAQEGSPGPLGGGPKSFPWGVKMLQTHYRTCVILRMFMFLL